jgi:hypothetical protein
MGTIGPDIDCRRGSVAIGNFDGCAIVAMPN